MKITTPYKQQDLGQNLTFPRYIAFRGKIFIDTVSSLKDEIRMEITVVCETVNGLSHAGRSLV